MSLLFLLWNQEYSRPDPSEKLQKKNMMKGSGALDVPGLSTVGMQKEGSG